MRKLSVISMIVFLAACARELPVPEHSNTLPAYLPAIDYPEDNAFTPERYAFGKSLFFDKRFSADGEVSCGTCHDPQLSFADDQATTPGSNGAAGTRNVPSLINIAYHPYFTREGGVPTLEMQVLVPIQEHNEFNNNIVPLAEMLNADPELQEMSYAAYGQEVTPYTITRALANFERRLLSGNSSYDRSLRGEAILPEDAERGRELFFSQRLGCGGCHNGFDLSTYEIVNNGLYDHYADPGLARLTGSPADSGKFKVATLRNVALTAPYMHDGSMTTLDEVIDHYASGGAEHPNKDERITAFELSETERSDLKAFLESLTDAGFYMP